MDKKHCILKACYYCEYWELIQQAISECQGALPCKFMNERKDNHLAVLEYKIDPSFEFVNKGESIAISDETDSVPDLESFSSDTRGDVPELESDISSDTEASSEVDEDFLF